MTLIVDTSVMVAAICSDDHAHKACSELLRITDEPIAVPELTLPEIDYWLNKWADTNAAITFLEDIRDGAYILESTEKADYSRGRTLMRQYEDAKVGLVDSVVLATIERLNEPKLATLDRRHFTLMRPRHVKNLTLLPARAAWHRV